jgi:hypothetical protein
MVWPPKLAVPIGSTPKDASRHAMNRTTASWRAGGRIAVSKLPIIEMPVV